MIDRKLTRIDWTVIVALAAGVVLLYSQTLSFDFVNYDDDQYVFDNPRVTSGLTWTNVKWAFTSGYASNWHPLTWMSHMLDAELFGSSPGGPHAVNAGLHAVNALLLFILLTRMTGQRWPSAFVAAAFAFHPLRAESVAWVSERKDVLSGLFFFLTLLLYDSYARARSLGRYGLVAGSLALGLMVKPILVTLPCLMLVLDIWPLRRAPRLRDLWQLVLEKLPLILICTASAAITYVVQNAGKSVSRLTSIPLGARAANAAVSYVDYLRDTFWPTRLTFFYPHPYSYPEGAISAGQLWISVTLLLLVTAIAVVMFRRAMWLTVGWAWFLGTLVPVIGIVQVGSQARADRYTYLATIGISIMAAYSATAAVRRWPALRAPAIALSAGVLLLLGILGFIQIGTWRDSLTLTRHGIAINKNNYAAYNNLGHELDRQGDTVGAEAAYREVLRIRPEDAIALNNLAVRLANRGETREAIRLYRAAIRRDPNYVPAIVQLANLYAREGRSNDAISLYQQAIDRDPMLAEAHHNYGVTLAEQGRFDEAMPRWQRAIELRPDYADAHHAYGLALVVVGESEDGISQLERALQIDRSRIDTRVRLAWIYATHPISEVRNAERAVALARAVRADVLTPDATLLDTLAAAEATAGQYADAARIASEAVSAAGDSPLAREILARQRLYEAGKPYIQSRGDRSP